MATPQCPSLAWEDFVIPDCHYALSALLPLDLEQGGRPTPVCGITAPQGGGPRLRLLPLSLLVLLGQ